MTAPLSARKRAAIRRATAVRRSHPDAVPLGQVLAVDRLERIARL